MGLWLTLGAVATIGAMRGESLGTDVPEPGVVQAGPLDDTIDYIECLARLLQGLPCDEEETTDPNQGDPVEPTP